MSLLLNNGIYLNVIFHGATGIGRLYPDGELYLKVELVYSIFEDTDFLITIVIGVHVNRYRPLNVLSEVRAWKAAIFHTPDGYYKFCTYI